MTGGSWPVLSALDARVLRASDARYERSPEKVGGLAGCAADVACQQTAKRPENQGVRRGCWTV